MHTCIQNAILSAQYDLYIQSAEYDVCIITITCTSKSCNYKPVLSKRNLHHLPPEDFSLMQQTAVVSF